MEPHETVAEVMAAVDAFYNAVYAHGRTPNHRQEITWVEVNRCRDRLLKAAAVYHDQTFETIEKKLALYMEYTAAKERELTVLRNAGQPH
jgi:hypothetical protein